MWYYESSHPLRRLFAGLTEQAFLETLGIGDPKLVDYLSLLLSRFLHVDAVTASATPKANALKKSPRCLWRRKHCRRRPDAPGISSPHRRLHPLLDRRLSRGSEAAASVLTKDHLIDYASRASARTTSPAPSKGIPTATKHRPAATERRVRVVCLRAETGPPGVGACLHAGTAAEATLKGNDISKTIRPEARARDDSNPRSASGRDRFYRSIGIFGGVKSAMKSCAEPPPRVEVHITFVPSGLNTGSTSAPGAKVSRTFLPVSMFIQYRS